MITGARRACNAEVRVRFPYGPFRATGDEHKATAQYSEYVTGKVGTGSGSCLFLRFESVTPVISAH